MTERLKECRRIVIKAGTSILSSSKGTFSSRSLGRLCNDVYSLVQAGKEIVLVSSGAIGLGMEVCGIEKRPKQMSELQACAAIGQGKLMHAYERYFATRQMHTGQVLLTRDGLERRDRFILASRTMNELLRMKVMPIVNENDTVSTEEIGFGDNDRLSVHVAHLVKADLVILLSDVDGFYLKDGSRIRLVTSKKEIEEELVKHLADRKKEKNVGGMKAKLIAASTAMKLGIPLLLLNGHKKGLIEKALQGADVGTLFLPGGNKRSARQMWISFSAPRKGEIIVDAGAYQALCVKKVSLLPSGITGLHGAFERGQVVELKDGHGKVFGRGVVKYGSHELARIAGKKSSEIHNILGYKHEDEVIHRNDLVIWD